MVWRALVLFVLLTAGLSRVAHAALMNVHAPAIAVTPVPAPIFGMSPRAFLPLVIVSSRTTTLPPGAMLPSDAQCAARVQHQPENKRMNVMYNAASGHQQLASDFFGGSDPRANSEIALRVTGNFTGTTDEVLQWVACKWGVDEDMVRAQAAIESWWHQDAKGDWGTDASRCPAGHGPGVDDALGHPDECPESWGVLQTRYPYEVSAWPGMADSTAFEADTAYSIWRACYEGYEWWLNQVERGKDYGSGDEWGCVGRWYAGRWHTQPAETYIVRVKDYLNTRIWEQPYFQEP
jgi:autotransporter family porin